MTSHNGTVNSSSPAADHTPREPQVFPNPTEFAAATAALRNAGKNIALVPTMGALHDGHLTLVRAAKQIPNSAVAVSIFVNPLQFGAGEDLDTYPRTLAADLAKLADAGVDMVFTPTPENMYPNGFRTTIDPGPLATELEGATRPGHFAGALTVCAKLFHLSHCTDVFFGEKDYQQLILMRQMVEDLNLPLTLHPVPIVREDSGLAMSSRNRYLSPAETLLAEKLSRALAAGQSAAGDGAGAAQVRQAALDYLAQFPEIAVEYVELRDALLGPVPGGDRIPVEGVECRLLLAARVGTTRLIDNAGLVLRAV